jgi:hypothetical protein
MDLAVAQFPVVEVGLFGPLAGEFLDPGNVLALTFALLDARKQGVGNGGVLVQEVVEVLLHHVVDPGADHAPLRPLGSECVEPSLVLVCDSNTGSCTRKAMAPIMLVRMSEASKGLL